MHIFFFGCHTAPDMSFGFVHIKNFSCAFCQTGIDQHEAFRHILMYRTLTDPKLFRSLTDGSVMLYNIIRNAYRPLFNIFLHMNSPQKAFLHSMQVFTGIVLKVIYNQVKYHRIDFLLLPGFDI